MRLFLSRLSLIGASADHNRDQLREIRTLNVINFSFLYLFTIIAIFDIALLIKGDNNLHLASLKTPLIAISTYVNLILNSKRLFKISKIVIVFIIPFILFGFPIIRGNIINEYFFWFPYIPSALCIVPHLLFRDKKDRFILVFALTSYAIFVIIIDVILLNIADQSLEIIPIIIENRLFYKVSAIAMFLFINAALLYFLNQSETHEKWISLANTELEEQREELRSQNEKLSDQQESLSEKNHELEQLLDQLKKAQSQLIQSEKMASLGTLTNGVAHEINNPLNYISAGLQTLDGIFDELKHQDISDNERGLLLNKCIKVLPGAILGVERISRIVRSLLSFSDTSKASLTNVHKVIESTLMIVGFKIPKDVTIEKNFNDELPKLSIQQDRLHQALLAIIDNAVEAINKIEKKDHKISFNTYSNLNHLCIAISNSGPSIPENIISKIYDPFFTTKDAGEGIGLGLTIAYNNIAAINGEIITQNSDNLVEFTIKLPLKGMAKS